MDDRDHAVAPSEVGDRWPGVLGTIGMILGGIMILDEIGDLAVVGWSAEQWSRRLGARVGSAVEAALPPDAWIVASSLVVIALGAALIVGSLRLARRRSSGALILRVWGWAAILWAVLEVGWAAEWLRGSGRAIWGAAGAEPDGAVLGLLLALVILVAYPLTLVVWLSRPVVRRQTSSWAA